MQYENRSVTRDGTALLAQSVNNAKPIIDKMLVLNSDIPLNKTVDTMTLSDFNNALSFDVNNVSQNDNSFTASAVITNDGINQDYPAQLIGITGYLDNSDDKKLFAVAQASEPFVIEKQNGTPIKFVPSLTFGFSNSNNVQLTVKNDVYVTQDDLNDLKKQISENIGGPDSIVSKNIKAMGTKANSYTDKKVETLDTQTSQGINNLGQQIGQLLDLDKFRDEFNGKLTDYAKVDSNSDFTGIKNFKNGLKIADKQLSIQDDHLYYDGKSVLIATAPNAPKLKLTFNTSNGNVGYSLSSSSIDGGASVTKYNLFYKKDSDSDWNSKVIDANNADGEIAVDSNSNYDFKANASNYAGTSDTSDTQTILTMDSNIYGASWNQGVSSALTRTDAAVGMVAGINGDRNDFDNTGIWGAMHRVQDDKGNIFVCIPKFYIKKTQNAGLSTWQVSLVKHDDSWYLPKCFWNFSSNQELPYVDVGAYLADLNGSVLESKVNTSPAVSQTIGSFRTYARNNGTGYQQLDIHVWDMLQVLFIIEFATLDSQSVMYGNANNYNSGYTDGMKGSSAGDSNNIKYRGIESMYCNIYQFVDGIGINSGNIYVCDDANQYSDSQFSYPYKPVSYRLPQSSGYMQSAGLDVSNPEVTLATSTTSTQGYYNDYCYNDSGSNYMMYAGGYGSYSGYGLFCAYVHNTFSNSYSDIGCRLIKKPVL